MSELSEENKRKIKEFWEQCPLYCSYIEEQLSQRINELGLVCALVEATGKQPAELAYEEWTREKIINAIKNSNYLSKIPVIEEEINLEHSIIPPELRRDLNEEGVKWSGEKWTVHKNDVDPFPSQPHAHNYASNMKLHLGNGDLYQGSRQVGSIPCKKLIQLRDLFKKTKMPALEC